MSTLALNKQLEYILSLSLSNSNKGWLAEKIIMSKTEETFQEMVFGSNQDSLEITISERIWGTILELVAAIAKVFNITDEDFLEAVVNESDELAHICELYKHKLAS